MKNVRKLSIIIPVKNEEEKLFDVIEEVKKLDPLEIIVIVNGSSDNTKKIASSSHCKVIEYNESLGHDIGRAVGAFYAKGEILLFVDGDIIITHMELLPFITAIEDGYDIALNNLEKILKNNQRPHSVSIVKKVINDLFGYSVLSINSLVATPHAISRNALQNIGWRNLAEPPLAQAIALKKKLSVICPAFVDVVTRNKIRYELHIDKSMETPYKPIEDIIFGDHLLAVKQLIDWYGNRGGAQDFRDRNYLKNIMYMKQNNSTKQKNGIKRSAVLSDDTKGNIHHLLKIIQAIFQAGTEEVIFISTEKDNSKLEKILSTGVKHISLLEDVGPFVSRAIGAAFSSGEKILFIDNHEYFSAHDIQNLFQVIEHGSDVSLIDRSQILDNLHPLDNLNSIQYFLNIAIKKPELWNNSLTYSPHVISKKCIEKIGFDSLMIPPLAYVKLHENNFNFSLVSTGQKLFIPITHVDFQILLGDHVEALEYFLSKSNERGNFSTGDRKFSALDELVKKGK